jgi:hypothetical protein
MISLWLLTVNYFAKLACADVSHYWRVSPQTVIWVSDRRIGDEQTFPTWLVEKPSVPTYSPFISNLATKITCFCSVKYEVEYPDYVTGCVILILVRAGDFLFCTMSGPAPVSASDSVYRKPVTFYVQLNRTKRWGDLLPFSSTKIKCVMLCLCSLYTPFYLTAWEQWQRKLYSITAVTSALQFMVF